MCTTVLFMVFQLIATHVQQSPTLAQSQPLSMSPLLWVVFWNGQCGHLVCGFVFFVKAPILVVTISQDYNDRKSPHLTVAWCFLPFPFGPTLEFFSGSRWAFCWHNLQVLTLRSTDTCFFVLIAPNSIQTICWAFQNWVISKCSCHLEEVTLFFRFWEGSLFLGPGGSSLCKTCFNRQCERTQQSPILGSCQPNVWLNISWIPFL